MVLSLHGPVTVKNDGIPHLVWLQKAIRAEQKRLYLCSLSSGLKKLRLAGGGARSEEIYENLMDVMRVIEVGRKLQSV